MRTPKVLGTLPITNELLHVVKMKIPFALIIQAYFLTIKCTSINSQNPVFMRLIGMNIFEHKIIVEKKFTLTKIYLGYVYMVIFSNVVTDRWKCKEIEEPLLTRTRSYAKRVKFDRCKYVWYILDSFFSAYCNKEGSR